ncbi:cysteine desulfurase family protein [Agrobacterium rhizogenes]|uniref:cysteine desulfurase family protein n=1 Tax=Rhizobium rhizogenes TaxID=359 RepID=UPI0022B6C756|nr:cysteine desulfurase family protein [Rhizobium rhizogenes]MCZ7448325.1 cysteine desulfurase family protein [Rhizobium rhizogenes]
MPVYLDYHSHAPMHPAARAATFEAYERFDSNPHSTHIHGTLAHDAVENSRGQVAHLIGARPSEIVFTSGATEANNLVFSGVRDLLAAQNKKKVVIGAVEHPSVLKAAQALRRDGFEVVFLPVHTDGLIDLDAAAEMITTDTGIVSVAAANHEVGVLQPLAALSQLVRTRGGLLHSDLAQAAGKIEIDLRVLDLASISSHKLGGPGGIGALYVRRLVKPKLKPNLAGGGQEAGLRSGTLPTPLCVGFGVACELSADEMAETSARVRRMRDSLLTELLAISGSRLNGSATARLPGNINISFEDVDGEALAYHLQQSVSVSTGSTCSSKSLEPSPVLLAMGLPRQVAESAIRIGLGPLTTEEDIEIATRAITASVSELRSIRRRA